jgi:tetraacyldisaccharide 4'-kinase
LRFLSWLYAGLVRLAVCFYRSPLTRSHDLGRPVVSVGNITWGGVGKTPVVAWLVRYFLDKGVRPAVLARGYRPEGGAAAGNDETRMLEMFFPGVPVIAGRDRARSARAALAAGPVDVFILDDAFQQWRVKRDLDVVLIDAARPFGNGFLLPRGPLREPLTSLKRADIVLLTKTGAAGDGLEPLRRDLRRFNPGALLVETDHRPGGLTRLFDGRQEELSALEGSGVCLLSAIGDPASFERLVRQQGADVRSRFFFPDHHAFTGADIGAVVRACGERARTRVVTTAKDAVKLNELPRELFGGLEVLVLNLNIVFLKGREAFLARRDALLQP